MLGQRCGNRKLHYVPVPGTYYLNKEPRGPTRGPTLPDPYSNVYRLPNPYPTRLDNRRGTREVEDRGEEVQVDTGGRKRGTADKEGRGPWSRC